MFAPAEFMIQHLLLRSALFIPLEEVLDIEQ